MKKRIWVGIALVILLAAFLILKNNFMPVKNAFNGSRIRNPDGYYMDFSYMNQEDSCRLQLQEEDSLEVSWEITKGRVSVKIVADDGTCIYQGDDIDTADFELGIPKEGTYTVYVDADKAAGRISVVIKK